MKISVIIPCYNSAETIERCLKAICEQTGFELNVDYEVLVIDDGSTDNSVELIQSSPFGVKVIPLKHNQGRIIARKTGTEAAKYETLLLIDSRVIADPGLLLAYKHLNLPCCYAGELGEEKNAANNPIDRLFYAMRCKYYFPYYPQQEENIELTLENFSKLPKGTTAFFCPKDVFLQCTPSETGKHVNDDSRLFSTILVEKYARIYRSTRLKVEYLQRDIGSVSSWLIGRGVLFTDFVFKKNPLYQMALLGSWIFIFLIITFGILAPPIGIGLMMLIGLSYGAIVTWLSKSFSDFRFFGRHLILVMLYFWWGVNKGLFLRFTK